MKHLMSQKTQSIKAGSTPLQKIKLDLLVLHVKVQMQKRAHQDSLLYCVDLDPVHFSF